MTRQRKRPLRLDRPNVVGIVQSPTGFNLARKPEFRGIHFFEVRLDAFARMPDAALIAELPLPVIATVRDAREGGRRKLSVDERVRRYTEVLPLVAAIDVELACRREMRPAIAAAREAGVRVIFSQHDFHGMPKSMRVSRRTAARAGGDVFKVAATPGSPRDLAALLELLDDPPIPTSVMGMGDMGKASRVAAIACGSVLNYGWLEKPNVAGQWSALELLGFLS